MRNEKQASDNGFSRIPLRDHSGQEVGALIFRADDISGISKRMLKFETRLCKMITPLRYIDLSPEGTATGAGEATLKRIEKQLYRQLDHVLGHPGAANELFRTVRPFASVKGDFFCTQIIRLIGSEVIKQLAKFQETNAAADASAGKEKIT